MDKPINIPKNTPIALHLANFTNSPQEPPSINNTPAKPEINNEITEPAKLVGIQQKGNIDFSVFKIGETFPITNNKILMIISSNQNYIVFIDDQNIINYDYNTGIIKLPEDSGKIFNKIALLEIKSRYLLSENQILPFLDLLGQALARMFEGVNIDNAENCLKEAENFLIEKSTEKAKVWYLESSFLTSLFVLILGIILYIFKSFIEEIITGDYYSILNLSLYGAFGAFFSIIIRTRELKFDYSAGKKIHIYESILRILTGVLGAFFVMVLIKSNMIIGLGNKLDASWWALIVFAIISGFSERFVPNIIKQFEDNPVAINTPNSPNQPTGRNTNPPNPTGGNNNPNTGQVNKPLEKIEKRNNLVIS